MSRRVFIIHGWGLTSQTAWIPWLKSKLLAANFQVVAPDMPGTDRPDIDTWVSFLSRQVSHPSSQDTFVAHSIGAQTVLRYLEGLPAKSKVGPVILVAPWLTLKPAAVATLADKQTARPWLTRPIDFAKVHRHAPSFTAFFSADDPYVDLLLNRAAFIKNLKAETFVQKDQGHFDQDSHVTSVPQVLYQILSQPK